VTIGLVVAALATGCGSDKKSGTADTAKPNVSASPGNGSSANKTGTDTSSAGITCPSAATVSNTVGHDVAVKGTQSNKYCEYEFKDQDANSISVIYVWSSFDVTQDPGVSSEPVSGVGQHATWNKEDGDLAVWTGKGGLVLTVFTIGFPNIDQKAAAIKLAKLVI
jgi:hypothetical protein